MFPNVQTKMHSDSATRNFLGDEPCQRASRAGQTHVQTFKQIEIV